MGFSNSTTGTSAFMNNAGIFTANKFSGPVVNYSSTYGFQQVGEIGDTFVNWNSTGTAAFQIDCQNRNAAYLIWRATNWGQNHLAAMHVHQSPGTISSVSLQVMGAGLLSPFVWTGEGDYSVARNINAGGTITPNSDIRLKNVVGEVENPMEKIRAIKNIIYTRKDIDNGTRYGYSAQSVASVMPEGVSYSKPGEHQKKFVDDKVMSVDYNGVSVLHNAALVVHDDKLLEIDELIGDLQNKVKQLMGENNA